MALQLFDGTIRYALNTVDHTLHLVQVSLDTDAVTDLGAIVQNVGSITVSNPTIDVGNVGLYNTSNVQINPALEGGNLATVATNTGTVATNTARITPATTFVGGTMTVTSNATPQPLVSSSTPCKAVWIGARQTNGTATNTGIVLIGDATTQNIPLVTTNFEGYTIKINNANNVFIGVQVSGEGVAYRILA
jgi:hypothetical protein